MMTYKRTRSFRKRSFRKKSRGKVTTLARKRVVRVILKKRRKPVVRKAALKKAGLSKYIVPMCKQTERLSQQRVGIATRVWGAVNLCRIPQSASNVQNARCGNDANIIGVHHVTNWANRCGCAVKVYEFWIIPKNYDHLDVDQDAALQQDFFTKHGQPSDNDADWLPNVASLLYDEPINKQKFEVLKKNVFILGAVSGGTFLQVTDNSLQQKANFKLQKFWIPIKRKFTFGSAVDGEDPVTPVQAPVFYINWAVELMGADATVSTPNALWRESHIITYFRDGESM